MYIHTCTYTHTDTHTVYVHIHNKFRHGVTAMPTAVHLYAYTWFDSA